MNHFSMPGVTTALVTPFTPEGSVDINMFFRLLQRQLDAGIRSIVVCGTTGEAPTLSDGEKKLLFRSAKEFVGSDGTIIAGTGSNCTEKAVKLSQTAQEAGADGLLVVTPYYNKASSDGLIRHYTAIAQAVSLPVILYNVPSRTGVDISPEVCLALSQIPNIVGIKEASGDLKKAALIRSLCPESFQLWSGCDDLTLPMMAIGAQGVISVLSNVLPHAALQMTAAVNCRDFEKSRAIFFRAFPVIQALFSEVNPIPVKAAMKIIGYDCGSCRLPLTDLQQEDTAKLKKLLDDFLSSELV